MRFWPFNRGPKARREDVERFLTLVVKSGLVASAELADECARCDADQTSPSALDGLCDYLASKSVLTKWQCDKLRNGKWKGFFLDGYCILELIGKDTTTCTYLVRDVRSSKRMSMRIEMPERKTMRGGHPIYSVSEIADDPTSGIQK